MLLAKRKIRKVVVIRPGALGDVLAVRGTIRFIKDAFPGCETVLIAPGERGAFFARDGWADRVFDWDRAAFSWLFSDGLQPPPPALSAVFAGSSWILAYMDGDTTRFEERLGEIAPAAGTVLCPSRPPGSHSHPIGAWLAEAAILFCRRYGLVERDEQADAEALAASRFVMAATHAFPIPPATRYAVFHPGSGSAGKNWPLDRFAALAARLRATRGPNNVPLFERLVVTSGEADGETGHRLADALPGAFHLHGADLETLAGALAHAVLYVGNDSGVSHLAAAVETPTGSRPDVAAIFGPSDPAVWAPPGALVLRAGADMNALSVAEAHSEIVGALFSPTPEKIIVPRPETS